ncbi:MAG: Thioredoxin reductase [Candidatus Moranbacteria bacterium GW2011_GWE1_35_17]|nr:MAG: Thioredoxin reductase [Candidatus Moranbacteria bacterium GW2011_GWE1_35_17]KKP67303.1 MAG: Thioredoxin reductase [Candidatus Moranbacteria bacterium GW2011_GWE2_35_164]KKP84700.1 MAG: Thioredoxin reductase [Candidatus Moranbacteria bacterium GW2011_GWF2_35_54]
MTEEEKIIYDLIIVGAGPAGLGASIYSSRYKLKHLVIGEEIGGQVVEASEIENWAGEKSISGKDLMKKFVDQTESLGATIIQEDVRQIEKKEGNFEVVTDGGKKYFTKTIILALGMKPRKMNVKGEKEFVGKGISYCATCDAMFFRDKDVVVIGGGDSAAMAAQHLTEFAKKVYVLHRCEVAWEPSREESMRANGKIELICSENITEIKGVAKVNAITYEQDGVMKELAVEGVFIEVGTVPGVIIAKNLGVALDDKDYVIVDQTQSTNVAGVWAAGDVTTGSNKFRQIITAVAEGAVASGSIYRKLRL